MRYDIKPKDYFYSLHKPNSISRNMNEDFSPSFRLKLTLLRLSYNEEILRLYFYNKIQPFSILLGDKSSLQILDISLSTLIYATRGISYSIIKLSRKIFSYDEFGLIRAVFLNTNFFFLNGYDIPLQSSLPSQQPSLVSLKRCENTLLIVEFQNGRQ